MLAVEIGIPQQVVAIDDAVKVGHASLGDEASSRSICAHRVDMMKSTSWIVTTLL